MSCSAIGTGCSDGHGWRLWWFSYIKYNLLGVDIGTVLPSDRSFLFLYIFANTFCRSPWAGVDLIGVTVGGWVFSFCQ
jgi:hypothetical protein